MKPHIQQVPLTFVQWRHSRREESRFFFLHTNATAYAKTASFDLLNVGPQALSPAYQTFAPAVPEPETYALFVAGLAVAGLAARRRRAA